MRPSRLLPVLSAVLLAGCTGDKPRPLAEQPPAVRAIDAGDVLRAIKADLGRYEAYRVAHDRDPEMANACRGVVNFRIKSVAISLVTEAEDADGASAGAKVPVAGIALNGGATIGSTRTRSQTVKLLLEPDAAPAAAAPVVAEPLPGSFDFVLRNLRTTLLKASDGRPCFRFPAEQANSIEAGFEVKSNRDYQFGIEFLIFSLGADAKSSDTRSNTITINFEGQGNLRPAAAPGAVRGERHAARVRPDTRGRAHLGHRLPRSRRIDPRVLERRAGPPPPQR